MKDLIQKIEKNPKQLFVVDGLGALLSSYILGIVLVSFEPIFGIPANSLYVLAIIPLFFMLFDFYSYWLGRGAKALLKIIASLNILYCCVSIAFACFHIGSITIFGWSYVLVEVLIVLILAAFEFKVSRRI